MRIKILIVMIFWIVLNHSGMTQSWSWVLNYNNSSNSSEIGTSIGTDKSGNIYVTGDNTSYTGGTGGAFDYFRMFYKYTSSGTLLWKDTLTNGNYKSVTDSVGNTYMIGGMTISKYDSTGQLIWSKTYINKTLKNLSLSPLGGIVAVGFFNVNNIQTSVIFRLDSNGNELWNRVGDFAGCDVLTTDYLGNTYIAGNTINNNISTSKCKKIDISGTLIASVIVPSDLIDIKVSEDLSIYGIGAYNLTNQSNTLYIMKYDSLFNNIWIKYMSGKNLSAASLLVDFQNKIYVSGSFYKSMTVIDTTLNCDFVGMYIIKIDENGEIVWIKSSKGIGSQVQPYSSILNHDNEIIFTGMIYGNSLFDATQVITTYYSDMVVGKLSQNLITGLILKDNNSDHFTIFPSPTTGLFQIQCNTKPGDEVRVTIINSLGQRVYSERVQSKEAYTKYFDFTGMAKGIYFVEMMAGKSRSVRKLLLE